MQQLKPPRRNQIEGPNKAVLITRVTVKNVNPLLIVNH